MTLNPSRSKLLWADGLAGAVAGTAMLLFAGWLSAWYRLPRDLMIFMGCGNLAYAAYSLSLAARRRRPLILIHVLVLANGTWALACIRWAILHRDGASLLGLVHLVGEALIVGGLAFLEWRWRSNLQAA